MCLTQPLLHTATGSLYGRLFKKSRIQEALNLSTDANSSTNTKTDRNRQKAPFFLFFFGSEGNKNKGGGQKNI